MATRKKPTAEKRPGPGRPTVGGPAGEPLTIRVPPEERKEWQAAAARYGASIGRSLSLANWVRLVCTEALRKPPKTLPSTNLAGPPYTLRVPSDERKEWEAAAANYGAKIGRPVSLSEWVRVVCTEAAARTA